MLPRFERATRRQASFTTDLLRELRKITYRQVYQERNNLTQMENHHSILTTSETIQFQSSLVFVKHWQIDEFQTRAPYESYLERWMSLYVCM